MLRDRHGKQARVNPFHTCLTLTQICCTFVLGVIYDFRKSYDDVFYTVGFLFFIDTLLFLGIPLMQLRREKMEKSRLDYSEIQGYAGQQHTQTFRITKRSISKSSLANGDADGGVITDYGTTAPVEPPEKQPPPAPPAATRPQTNHYNSAATMRDNFARFPSQEENWARFPSKN